MIKTRIYSHISKESAYEIGKEIGLSGKALEMFKHFNEVKLEIEVDGNSGLVKKVKSIKP